MSLWNPRKPLGQPPGYRQVTSVKETPAAPPVIERIASYAIRDSQVERRRQGGSAAIFGSVKR